MRGRLLVEVDGRWVPVCVFGRTAPLALRLVRRLRALGYRVRVEVR